MSIDRDNVLEGDYISDTFIQNSYISENEKDELRLVRDRAREAEKEYSEANQKYLKIQNVYESDKNKLRVLMEKYREAQTKYIEVLGRRVNNAIYELEKLDQCQNHNQPPFE